MSAASPLLVEGLTPLIPFVETGVLDASAVHVAGALSRAAGGLGFEVLLGAALAARAPRFGHVCVELSDVATTVVVDEPGRDEREAEIRLLPWPSLGSWRAALAASPAVRMAEDPPTDVVLPLVLDGMRLYLDRYWRYEQRTADNLRRLAEGTGALATDPAMLGDVLSRLFGEESQSGADGEDLQRDAVATALSGQLTVIAGGPGTGKTYTVERLLAGAYLVAAELGRDLEVALAAPTGKAAQRMTEAVRRPGRDRLPGGVSARVAAAEATTIHRLLGWNPRAGFAYDRFNPLPHDLVVVDETSMVSLPLFARLLDAVRPSASLVLVGDPFQLASVEAGAVLGEVVGPAAVATTPTAPAQAGPAPTATATAQAATAHGSGFLARRVVMLQRRHRFSGPIAELADAIRAGDGSAAVRLLAEGAPGELAWVEPDDDASLEALREQAGVAAAALLRSAAAGPAEEALRISASTKVLCATRRGPFGVDDWTRRIEAVAGRLVPAAGVGRHRWYVGRPVMVTENDYLNHLFNGDTGVVVETELGPAVAFPGAGGGEEPDALRFFGLSQLADVATWWATTIHKSQGSEFDRVVVSLPAPPSPVLTRELLYTAVTRAKSHVTVVASERALSEAIARPVARASGLGEKLWPPQAARRPRAATAQLLWTWRQSDS